MASLKELSADLKQYFMNNCSSAIISGAAAKSFSIPMSIAHDNMERYRETKTIANLPGTGRVLFLIFRTIE